MISFRKGQTRSKLINAFIFTALSIVIAFSAAADVRITDGEGQALIFPVYSTEKMDTLLSITNHRDTSKALSIVIREGELGAAVLAYFVYVPPHGTYRMNVSDLGRIGAPENIPGVISPVAQEICTIPFLEREVAQRPDIVYQNFLSFEVEQFGGSLASSSSGSVEVIEVGEVDPDIDANNCGLLLQRWTSGGAWFASPVANMNSPTGGISGEAWLLNVNGGESYLYQATAIDGLRTSVLPIRVGETPTILEAAEGKRATLQQGDDEVEIEFATSKQAASAALMSSAVETPVEIARALDAQTEVVVTFPSFFDDVTRTTATGNAVSAPFDAAQVFADFEFVRHDGNPMSCQELSSGESAAARRLVFDRAVSFIPLGAADAADGISGESGTPSIWIDGQASPYQDISANESGRLMLAFSSKSSPVCKAQANTASDYSLDAEGSQTVSGLPVLITTMTRIRNGHIEGIPDIANYTAVRSATRELIVD